MAPGRARDGGERDALSGFPRRRAAQGCAAPIATGGPVACGVNQPHRVRQGFDDGVRPRDEAHTVSGRAYRADDAASDHLVEWPGTALPGRLTQSLLSQGPEDQGRVSLRDSPSSSRPPAAVGGCPQPSRPRPLGATELPHARGATSPPLSATHWLPGDGRVSAVAATGGRVGTPVKRCSCTEFRMGRLGSLPASGRGDPLPERGVDA